MTIKGLKKRYSGVRALNGVDMEIESGKIIGLLGPNTAGKTTLLKSIAGLLRPDAGKITYPGGAQSCIDAKKTVSLLPDSMAFPSWMRVGDAFHFYNDMYPDYSAEKAEIMMKLLDLSAKTPIRTLSKGMQERVSLALTFSRETSVYLLDEPLGGIDPVGKMKILESILSMPLSNSAILLSTHLVRDVEMIFDCVLFISEGKIIFQSDCETLREKQGKTVNQVYLEVFSNAVSD